MRALRPYLFFILALFVLDQASKALIIHFFAYGEGIAVLPFFNLVHARNPGAAFSFLADQADWGRYFLLIFGVIVSGFLARWLYQSRDQVKHALPIAAILSGALGNIWDRLRYGYVIDFLDVYVGAWHWPAFNVADSAITLGVLAYLIFAWSSDKKTNLKK